jgi:hypothetical protein
MGFDSFSPQFLRRRASKGNPTSGPGSSYGLWKAQQLNLGSTIPRIQISLNQFGRILNHPRDTFILMLEVILWTLFSLAAI